MLLHVTLFVLLASALAQECSHDCCEAGGWCGDGVFDTCDGYWDYSIKCNPTYNTCCIPAATQPPTTTNDPTGSTVETDPPPTFPPGSCGVRPPTSNPARVIIGGEESVPNSWPWAVSIELDYFGWGGWEHYCGGVLIDNWWIVTAAHCVAKSGVSDPKLYRIVLRMHNKENKEPDVIHAPISKMIYHEDYSTDIAGSPNDIAMMKFEEPIFYDEKMSPVCLTAVGDEDYDFMDHTCYITGWGLTKGTGSEAVHREALIPVITNELCDRKWEEGSGRVDLIKESHICVGNGGPQGPGACNGDSGGPLSCLVDDQWVLAGVTSFGASGCVAEDAPDVYTRVPHFAQWIQDTMDSN